MKPTLLAGRLAAVALSGAVLVSCGNDQTDDTGNQQAAEPTVEEARAFVEDAEAELAARSEYAARIFWVNANFITDDTNWLAQKMSEEGTRLNVRLANETKRFEALDLPPELARKMNMLRSNLVIPAPEKGQDASELAEITTRLRSTYATGKGTYNGEPTARNDLEELMGTVRDPELLLEMWTSWREVSPPMKDDYARMVEIGNAGAAELGFSDIGTMWLSKYDMPPQEMSEEVDRLWNQVKPLYDSLHCYVRAELSEEYGEDVVPPTGPIPAHVLGNMWAQTWGNTYDLVAPENADPGYDLTERLKAEGFDARRIAGAAEDFFVSLGFDPLPQTFWERSLFTKPQDREVVCHASAWNIDDEDDVRIKMCTKVNEDDFVTMHHEIGHNIYQRAYKEQDVLYRTGANDGFHEAIGDMIALSVTPSYLHQIGLIDEIPDPSKDVGLLMQRALEGVAFLPFGLLVDKWRWKVFSGEVTPETYNEAWWDLRLKYQGIVPPVARGENDFDPGAKFHIPNNTPYLRYFLARILQYQFHKAACDLSGWDGPLHRCSIYGNKDVGAKFNAMLEMGASKPWPDALEAFTGSREIDGTAMIDYYAPLMDWLEERNKGRQCGW